MISLIIYLLIVIGVSILVYGLAFTILILVNGFKPLFTREDFLKIFRKR